MSQQQGRITDNLASIIQTIQFERRTGELHVKRSDGINTEQGSVMFIEGRAVQAQVGSRQGMAAFSLLHTWKKTAFVFIPHSSTYQLPAPSPTPPPPSPTPIPGSFDRFTSTRTSAVDHPTSQTGSFNVFPSAGSFTPLPENNPISRPGWTQPIAQQPPSTGRQNFLSDRGKQTSAHIPVASLPLAAVPRPTMSVMKAIGVINKAGLPRACRQVLLLVDGQHSVNDLISMSNLSAEETLKALNALQQLLVIMIGKPG